MKDLQISDSDIQQLLDALNQGAAPEKVMSFDAVRRRAIRDYDDIQACPGSGKTTLVGFKLLLLAKKWTQHHSGVCVLTHANVAKDEILEQLRRHPLGYKLLTYPHFIGTIQEFVNTFFGIPFCRSKGWHVTRIDDERCVEVLERRLSRSTRQYLSRRPHSSLFELKLTRDGAELSLNIPTFEKESKSKAYQELRNAKRALVKEGFFYYSEMYEFGRLLVHQNPSLIEALQSRFSVLLLDEMQDTQKFQDELITLVFPKSTCLIQRLGDPDQAIFDGIGGEQPNESYNSVQLVPIVESHRFSADIAQKIAGLSLNRLKLKTSRTTTEGMPASSIILYDDTSILRVIDRFAEVVGGLPDELRRTVKVVGGVAKTPDANALTIKSYWPAFDKTRSAKALKVTGLCQAVRYSAELMEGDVAVRYNVICDAVVRLLGLASKTVVDGSGKEGPVSRGTLRRFLCGRGQDLGFGELVAEWIMNSFPTEQLWARHVSRLQKILGLDEIASYVCEFLAFAEGQAPTANSSLEYGNIFRCSNGMGIEVSTIHAVKGETHDATLILETKHRKHFDLEDMIDYLCDENSARPVYDPAHPTTVESIRASFMKKLYVAASRPRYLLCLAMHRSRMPPEKRELLSRVKGWNIVDA